NFTLDGETTPITVANFLSYISSGRWETTTTGVTAPTFFHRSAYNGTTPFVIQAGGFLDTPDSSGNANPTQVATFAPIQNEPFISNTRGTIAMAKLGGDPNSATSQWFVNMVDNSANLDNQNSGFTVFGHVAGSGMAVADAIAALPRQHFASPFDDLPVRNYSSGNVKPANLITTEITQISPMIYTATSSNDNVATATGSGFDLLVKGVSVGTATINVTATDLDGASVSQSFNVTVNAAPARLTNISSRALCSTGDNVLIGGFIVAGGSSKTVIMRALGPSLAQFNVQNTIADPGVSLHDTQSTLASNDNWASGANAELITDLGRKPDADSEAALFATVPSGATDTSYTAIMQNNAGTLGVGIMEIYDLDSGPGSVLRNLSSRGVVGTGDNIMIGGFIIGGDGTRRIVVRAVGPTLAQFGVPDSLPNPTLDLFDGNGNKMTSNDDWQTNPDAAEIQGYGKNPSDPREAAIIATLPAGSYTALLRGTGDKPTGNALLELFDVP
ncbi:MAG: peptidylprolyl isomerase, partial [Chthoniobacterales bacterium]